MMFLAVTLGFFAENLREHLKESKEITGNIKSMVTDLKSDSAMYNQVFLSNEYAEKMIDTFITMLGMRSTNTAHIYF